jgi:pyruvate/2-oxoglutarate dehydrogenase complex dihydrolipoamide dehydrogenase (E3) component
VDLAAVRERKRAMIAGARQNYASRLAQDGLDRIEGEAHFTGPETVEIAMTDGGTRQFTGMGDVPVLDSTSIMELAELPEHLITLGGGYIGLESAQMYRRFGSEVTIIQARPRLMMMGDEDVSDEVAALLRNDGITVLTSSMPVRVEPADGGRLRLTVRMEDGERQFEDSHLLSATGRIPNTEALTIEAAGVRLEDHGFIEVDEYLETSVPGVYTMGDVNWRAGLHHLSYDDYRILYANLIRHEELSTRDRIVPYTVFIDPQLGRAGMTRA